MSLAAALLIAVEEPKLPGWMAGCWEQRSGEKWTEECWTAPRAGIMLGSGRSGTGGVLGSWEVMQIEVVETGDPAVSPVTFYGAPGGKNRTPFAWLRGSKEPGMTFINAGHDYPQRIRYWREGEELRAETSLIDGTKAMRWRYRRSGK